MAACTSCGGGLMAGVRFCRHCGRAVGVTGGAPPEPSRPSPPARAGAAITGAGRWLHRWARARSRRTWIRVGIGAAVVVAAAVGGTVAMAVVGASHTPQVAATDFLRALSARDVRGMLANAVLPTQGTGAPATVTLLSEVDIAKEIALPSDAIGPVRALRVVRSGIVGDAASVELQYVAGGQAHVADFSLVKASTGSGWAVQVQPAVLHISVPQAGEPVTVAGIRVPTGRPR